MRFRPSGDRFRFFFFAGLTATAETGAVFLSPATVLRGLPAFLFVVATPPMSIARACCRFAISRSSVANMSEIAMYSPWVDSGYGFVSVSISTTYPEILNAHKLQ